MRSVCVYCGSSSGVDGRYGNLAREVGARVAGARLELVYGGGTVGLMGVVADAALAAGGRVTGVIPAGLFETEVGHTGLTELIEVSSMHERKLAMFERADAFVALPGGLGTLEELTEMATWAQLRIHAKPVFTLGCADFWLPFHQLLDHFVEQGFMKPGNRALVVDVDSVDDLMSYLQA